MTFHSETLIAEVLDTLSRELSQKLRYHCVEHTKEVLGETVLFAHHDGLEAHNIELLSIAAAYHDAGYLERYPDNEVIGAAMAAKAMRSNGVYTEADIAEVEKMIMSTTFIQASRRVCHSPLSAYLMDADWGVFGREDFFEKCEQLIEETGAKSEVFYRQSLELVTNHVWLTPAAHELRETKKQQNIEALKEQLNSPPCD